MADDLEQQKRGACFWAIERLCETEGEPVPDLDESSSIRGGKRLIQFEGNLSDGRRFGIGYELDIDG